MLQVGAQNQNTVGLPANDAASMAPPPTAGAVNWSASGTAIDDSVADVATGAGDAVGGSVAVDSATGEDAAAAELGGCAAAAAEGDTLTGALCVLVLSLPPQLAAISAIPATPTAMCDRFMARPYRSRDRRLSRQASVSSLFTPACWRSRSLSGR
jgi:hypothetical protein